MPAKPVLLPSRTFSRKGDAEAFFSEMLNRYEDGEIVTIDDGALLYELLLRHPHADEKIGCGVADFTRLKTEQASSSFHIIRVDGSKTDFSFYRCIDGKSPTLNSEFYTACRLAVSNELREEKALYFRDHADDQGRVECQRTGALIAIEEADYRHTTPKFIEIVNAFLVASGTLLTPSLLAPSRDMQYGNEIAEDSIRQNFCTFHRNLRRMEVVKRGTPRNT